MNETIRLILIFCTISVIVLIIANLEMYINKNKSIYSGQLMKRYEYITPAKSGLHDPVWIFNSKNIKAKDIEYPRGHNKSKYVKSHIDEHLASKLNRPLKELLQSLVKLPRSSMPLNTLYTTISKGEEAVFSVDPGSIVPIKSNYKILHSTRDNIEAFISNDQFYILLKDDNNKESTAGLMKN